MEKNLREMGHGNNIGRRLEAKDGHCGGESKHPNHVLDTETYRTESKLRRRARRFTRLNRALCQIARLRRRRRFLTRRGNRRRGLGKGPTTARQGEREVPGENITETPDPERHVKLVLCERLGSQEQKTTHRRKPAANMSSEPGNAEKKHLGVEHSNDMNLLCNG